jgi:MoxR-like ATPase
MGYESAMDEIRLPAESRFEAELSALQRADDRPRPPGWRLSPAAVETYVLGARKKVDGVEITPKFIGDRALVQVAIATLASDRALMLVGEPGTAKSWLSEHLSAAICGTSALVVQGTAGTTEEHIKYSWNYALLLAEGPSEKALVPSPIYRAMAEGKFARLEEVTRTSSEVQDSLISLLSEKQLAVPELNQILAARRGFNVIATANTRDRGVNEMSAALKRRFNFVTVPIVEDLEQEIAIVTKREAELRGDYEVAATPPRELVELLVTVFQELRTGMTKDKKTKVKQPTSVLSTAEAISVIFNSAILSQHFGDGKVGATELSRSLLGAVAKESGEDLASIREYCETVAKGRGGLWKQFYAETRKALRG